MSWWRWGLGLVCGAALAPFACPPVAVLSFGLVSACLCLWWVTERRSVALTSSCSSVLVGLLSVALQPEGPEWEGWYSVKGEVSSVVGRERSLKVHAARPLGGLWSVQSGAIWVRFGQVSPPVGSHVVVAGRSSMQLPKAKPGAPNPKRSADRGRVRSVLRASQWSVLGPPTTRCAVRNDPTGVLSALVCGDRTGVSPERRRLFRRTGVAHVLAVSGFHVGLVMGWTYGCARAAQRLMSLWWSGGFDSVWAALLGMYAAWFYVTLANSPVSGVRALWMCSLALLARELGVRLRAEDVLGMAACAAVIMDPVVVSTVSFQLSYGAVCGLVRFGPAWRRPTSWRSWFRTSVQTSIAATAGTLPAIAWWFQELSMFGVWVNVWAMPWVAMVVAPLSFVSAVDVPWISVAAARWGSTSVEWFCAGLSAFDVEPFHPIVNAQGALLLGAILVSSLRARTSAIFAILVLWIRVVPC